MTNRYLNGKIDKKLVVYDLFAGAGGFGLGFEMSGYFKLGLSLEKDLWAVDTLKANNKINSTIIHDDIRKFKTKESILNLCGDKMPDVIIGGPPCQGFSLQGPTKDPNDPRNSLFQDFARWVDTLKPKVFVMENVTGLLSRKNIYDEKVIDIIIKTFKDIGYHVQVWNLNSANYVVPQLRNRIFIVGNIYGKDIPIPIKTHYTNIKEKYLFDDLKPGITIAEAIDDLPYVEAWEGAEKLDYTNSPNSDYQKWIRSNSKYVFNHVAMNHTKRMTERFRQIQSGLKIKDLPDSLKVRKRSGEGELSDITFTSNYRHLKSDIISYTIPASFYSTFIHPTIPRNITSREAARIQSFPDWYIFKGQRTVMSSKLLIKMGKESLNYLSQYNQIGNAVPPLLAMNISEQIKVFLLENLPTNKILQRQEEEEYA
jgi:DNA (cytosine-5)-methyltransferase 1